MKTVYLFVTLAACAAITAGALLALPVKNAVAQVGLPAGDPSACVCKVSTVAGAPRRLDIANCLCGNTQCVVTFSSGNVPAAESPGLVCLK